MKYIKNKSNTKSITKSKQKPKRKTVKQRRQKRQSQPKTIKQGGVFADLEALASIAKFNNLHFFEEGIDGIDVVSFTDKINELMEKSVLEEKPFDFIYVAVGGAIHEYKDYSIHQNVPSFIYKYNYPLIILYDNYDNELSKNFIKDNICLEDSNINLTFLIVHRNKTHESDNDTDENKSTKIINNLKLFIETLLIMFKEKGLTNWIISDYIAYKNIPNSLEKLIKKKSNIFFSNPVKNNSNEKLPNYDEIKEKIYIWSYSNPYYIFNIPTRTEQNLTDIPYILNEDDYKYYKERNPQLERNYPPLLFDINNQNNDPQNIAKNIKSKIINTFMFNL